MRKLTLLWCCLLLGVTSFAQAGYEKGYVIGQDGNRVECYIKNNDWANSPVIIKYRLPESEEIKEGNPKTIKEFGITTDFGVVKYIGGTVQIDKSLDASKDATIGQDPAWETKSLFLKVLVESKASLYVYESGAVRGYFYAVDGAAPRQLVYKKYWAKNGESRLMYNNGYRSQLWTDVKCPSMDFASLERLRYVRKDLEKYFHTYNECMGSRNGNAATSRGGVKETLHLSIQTGITYGNLSPSLYGWNGYEQTVKGISGFKFGIAAEFILPFNKGKWGLLLEPSFERMSGEDDGDIIYFRKLKAVKNVVELPIGFRYYFAKKKQLKYYLSVLGLISFNSRNSRIEYFLTKDYPVLNVKVPNYAGCSIGPGLSFGRLGADLRYTFNTSDHMKYHGVMLTARFRVF